MRALSVSSMMTSKLTLPLPPAAPVRNNYGETINLRETLRHAHDNSNCLPYKFRKEPGMRYLAPNTRSSRLRLLIAPNPISITNVNLRSGSATIDWPTTPDPICLPQSIGPPGFTITFYPSLLQSFASRLLPRRAPQPIVSTPKLLLSLRKSRFSKHKNF